MSNFIKFKNFFSPFLDEKKKTFTCDNGVFPVKEINKREGYIKIYYDPRRKDIKPIFESPYNRKRKPNKRLAESIERDGLWKGHEPYVYFDVNNLSGCGNGFILVVFIGQHRHAICVDQNRPHELIVWSPEYFESSEAFKDRVATENSTQRSFKLLSYYNQHQDNPNYRAAKKVISDMKKTSKSGEGYVGPRIADASSIAIIGNSNAYNKSDASEHSWKSGKYSIDKDRCGEALINKFRLFIRDLIEPNTNLESIDMAIAKRILKIFDVTDKDYTYEKEAEFRKIVEYWFNYEIHTYLPIQERIRSAVNQYIYAPREKDNSINQLKLPF